ncbi:MAG TPA: hypothetical protein VNC50_03950, partial [Planctomycetia bacterium]|nr:hypothetical protein [Planctomycetia bacterium]
MSDAATKGDEERIPPSPRMTFRISLAVAVVMAALVILSCGRPANWWTWIGLLLGFVPVAFAWRVRGMRINYAALTTAYFLFILIPLWRYPLLDLRGGRRGFESLPGRFRFVTDGPNTALLEAWLGPLNPDWRNTNTRNGLLDTFNDGGYVRVNRFNLIFLESLPKALERLPDDSARRRVLACLTDSSNLLRTHQSLLLACLVEIGFPPGTDSDSWWAKHAWVFRQERDPVRAARDAWGWRERIPSQPDRNDIRLLIRAVTFQELFGLGGNESFGEAHHNLVRTIKRD